RRAGLLQVDQETGKITGYEAYAWENRGSAEIVLKDQDDSRTRLSVRHLLERAKKDPDNGISKIIELPRGEGRDNSPNTAFIVTAKSDHRFISGTQGGLHVDQEEFIKEARLNGLHEGHFGDHGHSNDETDPSGNTVVMDSICFIKGPNIPNGSVNEIRIVDIAPTIASAMGVSLPSASGKSLDFPTVAPAAALRPSSPRPSPASAE
ncbi:hypothetical protein ACFL6C_06700, partial [Myxococcota bacterium]